MRNKAHEIDKYLVIKKWICKKLLFSKKIALACEDEILNINESSLDDKKITFGKKLSYLHYFIDNYMFIIISCHLYYLFILLYKSLDKKEYELSYLI